MHARQIITTCTRDCPSACGLLVTVEDGRIAAIRGNPHHPHNQGQCCAKTRRFARRMHHPQRVLHPLYRADRMEHWKRIPLEDALNRAAEWMHAALAKAGPLSICYYQGSGERTALKLLNERFFNHLGGVTTIQGSLCSGVGPAAQQLDVGTPRISHDPLDHRRSKSIVLWGRNPAVTNRGLMEILKDCRRQGTRIMLVDPCRTQSAVLAERHIAPAPGRDACLAMAVMRLVLDAGREAKTFLEAHAVGVEALRQIVLARSVEDWATEAGVGLDDVHALAACYQEAAPCATLLGWGCLRYAHGHLTVRAVDALGALTGNLGIAGGGVSQGFEEYGPYDDSLWGRSMARTHRRFHVARIGQEVAAAHTTGPAVELFVVSAANPVTMSPDSFSVLRALSAVPRVIQVGHFLDDTSLAANLFLPATMFPEQGEDLVASYGHHYVGPLNQCEAPRGDCLDNYDLFRRLSRRFDFHGEYDRPRQEWLERIAAPLLQESRTLEDLLAGPVRWEQPAVPYAGGLFHTPDGKFHCLDAFPLENLPRPQEDYPFQLLSVSPMEWLCSELTEEEHPPVVPVFLHPQVARDLGLEEGETVHVISETGRLEAVLRLDAGLRQDVARMPRGGWLRAGHGVNSLTRAMETAVGGGTPYYETRVRVTRLEPPPPY